MINERITNKIGTWSIENKGGGTMEAAVVSKDHGIKAATSKVGDGASSGQLFCDKRTIINCISNFHFHFNLNFLIFIKPTNGYYNTSYEIVLS